VFPSDASDAVVIDRSQAALKLALLRGRQLHQVVFQFVIFDLSLVFRFRISCRCR